MDEPILPNASPQAFRGTQSLILISLGCAVVLFISEESHWLSHSVRGFIFAVMIVLLSGAAAPLSRVSLKYAMLSLAITICVPGLVLLYVAWRSLQDGSSVWYDWSTLSCVAVAAVFFLIAKALFNGFRDEQKFGHLYRRS